MPKRPGAPLKAGPAWLRVCVAAVVIAGSVLLGLGGELPWISDGGGDREGEREVIEWFESRRSGEMVTVVGTVDRVLADDNDGSRHQRFIVRLGSGHTVLVAHNIDLAPKVPLGTGARVRVRGEYEWNEQGGVLHWTHHDSAGDRVGGWVAFDGAEYR